MHSIARFLGTLVCLQLATTAAIAKPGLEKLKGGWASDPSRCNQPVERDDDLRLHVEGTEFSFGETICKVVDVKQPRSDTFLVQAACSAEGEPGLFSYRFHLKSGSLAVSNGDWKWTFSSCKPKSGSTSGANVDISRKLPVVVRGRCHMDHCAFTKIVGISLDDETSDNRLVRIETTSASVKAPADQDGNPDYARVQVSQFPTRTDDVLVNCSKSAPFVAYSIPRGTQWFSRDARWYAHLLNLPDGVFGYNAASHSLYWAVCHEVNVGADDLFEPETKTILKSFEYRPAWPVHVSGQKEFRSVDQIRHFARARKFIQDILANSPMPVCYEVVGVPAGDELNVRSQPSVNSSVITRLQNGHPVSYGGKEWRAGSSTWIFISYNVSEDFPLGWVNAKFLREVDWNQCDPL